MTQLPLVHASPNRAREVDAIVVGAGFSGLYMLYKLRELGLTTRAFDAADGPGGTWYWNRYPGARCDSESHYYCYSFSDEIRNEWKWSCRYPAQVEILEYLNFVADRLDLRKEFDFGTRVIAGNYDEAAKVWIVETDEGEIVRARFLITGVGCTSATSTPVIPGLENFAGKVYHTANWPHEKVDFAGQRVGLIGTGSSGIQSTPHLAESAEHLTVFQRTANYSVPARNHLLTDEMRAEQNANFKELRVKTLASPIGMPFDVPQTSALAVSDEERKRRFDELWAVGGFRFMFTSYSDLVVDMKANDTVSGYISAKIRETVKDPAKAETLCQFNHPAGTKRPPIDTNYYETFNRDDIDLVNIRANPISGATSDGLTLDNGDTYKVDAIVFATGFDAVTGSILNMNLNGRGGKSLADKWANGALAYLGLCSAGFPNMFMITGPGSPSILANFPVAIEQHVDWIADVITSMRDNGQDEIEASAEAEADWMAMIAEEAGKTLLPLANSWYMGANIPGKPRMFLAYPNGVNAYAELCDGIAKRGYDGFAFHGREMADA